MNIWYDVNVALSKVPVNAVPLTDDTDFKALETAVAYNASGMALYWHFVDSTGAYTVTAVTPTTAGVYDWAHQQQAMYTIEIPASGGGSINNNAAGFGWFTGLATGVLPWRGPTLGFRAAILNDVFVENTDLLDVSVTQWTGTNVAAPDTAGYPKVTHKTGTGAGELSITSGVAAVNMAQVLGTALTDSGAGTNFAGTLAANLSIFFGDTRNNGVAATGGGNIGLIKTRTDRIPDIAPGSAGAILIAGSNTATTFATLTSTGAFSINGVSHVSQTADVGARLTAARAGYLDFLNVGGNVATSGDVSTVYSRIGAPVGASISADIAAAYARIGAPVGASISADIAATHTRLGAPAGASTAADIAVLAARLTSARAGYLDFLNVGGLVATSGDVSNVYARIGAPVGATISADIATKATAAQVNAQVLDVLTVDTFAEPGTKPSANNTPLNMLYYIWMALHDRVDVDASAGAGQPVTKKYYNRAGQLFWTQETADTSDIFTQSLGVAAP